MIVLDMHEANTAMNHKRLSIWKAVGLLTLGLGIGSGSTVLLQHWNSNAMTAPEMPAERLQPPLVSLTTALMLAGEPVMGSDKAPLTIVEFSDFECRYCRLFHEQVFPSLRREYIDTGLVRFIHKDLPLPFHDQAWPASAAARCAGEQQRYWDFHHALFDQQNCLKCKGVIEIAKELRIDTSALQACMQRESTDILIKANLSEAHLNNIYSTPTFVIGPSSNDGKHDGKIVEGAMPWPKFKALIDQQLNSQKDR